MKFAAHEEGLGLSYTIGWFTLNRSTNWIPLTLLMMPMCHSIDSLFNVVMFLDYTIAMREGMIGTTCRDLQLKIYYSLISPWKVGKMGRMQQQQK